MSENTEARDIIDVAQEAVGAQQLLLGFKLNRPKDTLQSAFDDVVTAVQGATGRDVWATS